MVSDSTTKASLFGETLNQVDELTKILDSACGTVAIPPFFDTLLHAKLELLRWCEPDLIDQVDTQSARLLQLVEIRVRLQGKNLHEVTWTWPSIDDNLIDQLKRVLSLLSQDHDWSVHVLDVLTRTRHELKSTNIQIDWLPWEDCYWKLLQRFLKETDEQFGLQASRVKQSNNWVDESRNPVRSSNQ